MSLQGVGVVFRKGTEALQFMGFRDQRRGRVGSGWWRLGEGGVLQEVVIAVEARGHLLEMAQRQPQGKRYA